MTDSEKTKVVDDRAVAQGNHKHGYRGVIIRGWDTESEQVVMRCKHHHPTTGEARSCIGRLFFHASGDIAAVEVVDPPRDG
jgi:hypothetical protein